MKNSYNIVGNRNKFFAFSLIVIAVIIAVSVFFGVPMDIEFKGGALLTYSYSGDLDAQEFRAQAEDVFDTVVTVQTGQDIATNTKTVTINAQGTQTIQPESIENFATMLDESYAENNFNQLEINNVNPVMGAEFFAKCIVAVIMASILILIYISIRFKKIGGWSAGVMAVVALVHDLIIVYGVFVIARIPLDSNFIAAMLVILGYSINDTVVVYDRVRENGLLVGKNMPFDKMVNLSINQSLKRSINTTISTVLALGAVCVVSLIYGLDSIFTFALPLIIGMISGVYSTIFIAGPLWVVWKTRKITKTNKAVQKKTSK